MKDEIYERLADALDRLPNGFPRTPSNIEIPLLKKIFSPEEAWLASQLTKDFESVESIADRTGLSLEEATERLTALAQHGFALAHGRAGSQRFRLMPFVVGIYETQLEKVDHEFAHLFEEYMADGGAAGIMKPYPSLHRVIPTRGAVKTEWVLPYDDIRAMILASKSYRVRDCICRIQQAHMGHQCQFPLKVCLSFYADERPASPYDISQEEALALLDRTEEAGLVHTASNMAKGLWYVCNCCGCCCGILRGINDWGVEESVAHANYYAVIDPDECVGCGTCIERCQVHAISEHESVSVVDREKCIGCGLCVTGCPSDVARLQRKPDDQIVHPPENFLRWEQERLRSRGLNG